MDRSSNRVLRVHKHVVASGYLHFDHSFEKSKMLLALLIKVALITTVVSDRLEPGEPGGKESKILS